MPTIQEVCRTIYTKNDYKRLVVPNDRVRLLVDDTTNDDDILIDLICDFNSLYPSLGLLESHGMLMNKSTTINIHNGSIKRYDKYTELSVVNQ